MKELQDSTVLEQEIRGEASRQAARIMAEAEQEAARVRSASAAMLREGLAELRTAHETRLACKRAAQAQALPLEQLRLRLDFLGQTLHAAVNQVLAAMGGPELWASLAPGVAEAASQMDPGTIRVFIWGFEPAARDWLQRCLPDRRLEFAPDAAGWLGIPAGPPSAGRGLELLDAGARCRYRLDEAALAEALLETWRSELVLALFPDPPRQEEAS